MRRMREGVLEVLAWSADSCDDASAGGGFYGCDAGWVSSTKLVYEGPGTRTRFSRKNELFRASEA